MKCIGADRTYRFPDCFTILEGRIKPGIPRVRVQHEWHPVMNCFEGLAGRVGDDRERRLCRTIAEFIDAGEEKQPSFPMRQVVRRS